MDTVNVPKDVCTLFNQLALDVIARGFKRYSARAILHRIRWHAHVERGDANFKVNNNWSAPLARSFVAAYPEHAGFFELREKREEK